MVLDQYTKNLVRTRLALGEVWLPFGDAVPFVRVVHWYNTGVAFGMFQGRGLIFTILAFVVIGLIYYFYAQVPAKDWPLRIAMILQVGGAAGNLVDRLQFGQVTDFISVGNFAVLTLQIPQLRWEYLCFCWGFGFKIKPRKNSSRKRKF